MTAYSAEELEREGIVTAHLLIIFLPLWAAEIIAACLVVAANGWVMP